MPTFVGVLRAINLGSHNKIAMSDLRAMCEKLGYEDAKTLLLSGNIVFKSRVTSTAKLEAALEAASTRHLAVTTDYFVRSAKEWQAAIDANPFHEEAKADPGHLLMMCLRHAPSEAQVTSLRAVMKGPEIVEVVGKQAYFLYRAGIGQSKLTIKVIEKALGTRGTGRNWNTVLKIGNLLG